MRESSRPKFSVLKILTSKLLDIKILQTLFAEPAPTKASRGYVGGVPPILASAQAECPTPGGPSELYFRAARRKLCQNGLVGTVAWGFRMSCRKACLVLLLISSTAAFAQVSHS